MAYDGFTVPNTPDVNGVYDVAEPDAVDFNILGNHRHGVIAGCVATQSGVSSTVNVSAGLAVVNGAVVSVSAQQALVGAALAEARFDLLVVSVSGQVSTIQGAASTNPVFPVVGDDRTVLAAIYISASGIVVTDKRVMVLLRLATAVSGGSIVISADPATAQPKFTIEHDGGMRWPAAALDPVEGGLRLSGLLQVANLLVAQALVVDGGIAATGSVTGSNLGRGADLPATGSPGDLFQRTVDGTLWLYDGDSWDVLSTDPTPVGTVQMTMLANAPAGWLMLDGRVVAQSTAGRLWDAFPQWRDGAGLRLPDARNRVPLQGTPASTGGSSTVVLSTVNMPAHVHGVRADPVAGHVHSINTQSAGAHSHSTLPGGNHRHVVSDEGHFHTWADGAGGGAFIAKFWGGTRRLDGPFNDASHPVAVQEVDSTTRAISNVQVTPLNSEHQHEMSPGGEHAHQVSMQPDAGFTPVIRETPIGSGAPVNILPPFFGVNFMIKT